MTTRISAHTKNDLSVENLVHSKTIASPCEFKGIGLFTGVVSTVSLIPSRSGGGIRIKRVDLPNCAEIPVQLASVHSIQRCVILGSEACQVVCVEHILSALKAYEVDDLLIEIDGPEIPIGDGSSLWIAQLLDKVGVELTGNTRKIQYISEPIYYAEGNTQLIALPAIELQYSFTLSYPGHPLLDGQFYTYLPNQSSYLSEIAPSRTFALKEEIGDLLGTIVKGGSLETCVVIDGKEALNPEGLRFPNEMVRHKILDLIGDLSLIGYPLIGHFISIRSGHSQHIKFVNIIDTKMRKER